MIELAASGAVPLVTEATGMPSVAWVPLGVAAVLEARNAFVAARSAQRRVTRLAWNTLGAFSSFFGGGSLVHTLVQDSGNDSLWFALGGLTGLGIAWYLAETTRRERESRATLPPSDPASRDPGWPNWLTFGAPLYALNPVRRRANAAMSSSTLAALRWIFEAITASLVVYWLALSFEFHPTQHSSLQQLRDASGFVVVVILVSVIAHSLGTRFESRVIGAEPSTLVSEYRTMFFVRIGTGQLGAIVAFLGSFYTGSPLLYPLALACALPVFVGLAPSARNLQRFDEARRQRGSLGSLYEALLAGPPPPPVTPPA